MTLLLKDMRRKLRYRLQNIVVTGGLNFPGPFWDALNEKIEQVGMITTTSKDRKRGISKLKAVIEEWYKLYDKNVFSKIKLLNGTHHNITMTYIELKYFANRKYLEYEAAIVCD